MFLLALNITKGTSSDPSGTGKNSPAFSLMLSAL
jgi:hypothetical protein